ncbi:hypothetical protein EWU39_10835 [Enterococcus faecium]|nr:hypothetical protein EWU39_10835 [Enterococcus faecium]TAQ22991.1 hypothetical protein EWU31_11020 [Enterococcus faecium]
MKNMLLLPSYFIYTRGLAHRFLFYCSILKSSYMMLVIVSFPFSRMIFSCTILCKHHIQKLVAKKTGSIIYGTDESELILQPHFYFRY